MVFTNIRPIWMLSQETRDVGSRWMSPTLVSVVSMSYPIGQFLDFGT